MLWLLLELAVPFDRPVGKTLAASFEISICVQFCANTCTNYYGLMITGIISHFSISEEILEGNKLRSFNYFKNSLQSIEIIKDGHLQKVYFITPSKVKMCKCMS